MIAFARSVDLKPLDEVRAPPSLYVIATAGGQARRLTRGRALKPKLVAGRKIIAFDDGRRIGIVGRQGGRIRFIASGTDPAWSRDGNTIAFVRNRNIWIADRTGRRGRLAVRNAAEPARRPSP